jgi:DNA-binding transcriptional regulator YiaG
MPNQQKFFNPEKALTELYTEKWLEETCTVKDITDLTIRHHYWEAPDGELWGDFNSPMENIHLDFQAYRQRKEFLTPTEIVHIRQQLHLTVREFADILGLGISTVSQIENNERIQTKYQDNLFRWAQGERFTAVSKKQKRA